MWQCPQCNEELGDYNAYCEFCRFESKLTVFNPDKYFVRDICIYHIEKEVIRMANGNDENDKQAKTAMTKEEVLQSIEANERMTPQEKLHAKLFFHESYLVKDMNDLKLSAHIEELSQICFEGRARLGAATAERDKRKTKPAQGFERSLRTDETSTNAINIVKERVKRLSKKELIEKQLKELYSVAGVVEPAAEAAKAVSARNMSEVVNRVKETSTSRLNPFAKKSSPVDDAINAILNPSNAKMIIKDKS
jgi:hypothetical protein